MATYQELLAKPPGSEYDLYGKVENEQENFERGQLNYGLMQGRKLADMTPEERAFMQELAPKGAAADAGVMDEMGRLRQRGDDLANVDEAYMERAYKPAFERLMEQYQDMDQGVIENMNARGIAAQGSSADNGTGVAGSEPEAYQRMLLARDTKNQMGRTMLEAQNQAVQQKLAQYQGRLAETGQANERFGQVQAPVIGANVAGANERLGARTGAGTTTAGQKLGYASDMHKTNTTRKIAGQEQMLGGVGMGLNFTGDLINAAASAAGGGKK